MVLGFSSTTCFAQTMPSEYGNGLSNRPATSTTSAFPTVTSQLSSAITSPAPTSLIPAFNSNVVNNNNSINGFGNNVGNNPNNGAFGNNGNQVNTGYGGYNGGQSYGSQSSNCGTVGFIGVAGGRGDAIGNTQSAVSIQGGWTFNEQRCVDQKEMDQARSATELAREGQVTRRWCVGAMLEAGKLPPSPQTDIATKHIMSLCTAKQ